MTEERDWEAEATEQGWKPKEEFQGPEDKWTDAQTFVEKGDKIAGILKSRLDRTEAEIQKLKADNKAFGEYQKSLLDKEKATSAKRLAELEALRATAISDADGAEFTRLDHEIHQVRESLDAPDPRANGEQELNVLAQAWLLNNGWYNTNPKLQIYADGLAERVEAEGYTGSAYFTELTRRVKEAHPEEFQNKRQTQSNSVESGGEIETGSDTPKTYDDLPADAKAACDRFVKGGFTTKEEYVATYDFEE
jgi:hypothetical protein